MKETYYALRFDAYDPEGKLVPDSGVSIYTALCQAIFGSQAKMTTAVEIVRAAEIQRLFDGVAVELQGPRGPYTMLNPLGAEILISDKQLLSIKEDWRAWKANLGKGQARLVLAVDQFLDTLTPLPDAV